MGTRVGSHNFHLKLHWQNLSSTSTALNNVSLKPGMTLSNGPSSAIFRYH